MPFSGIDILSSEREGVYTLELAGELDIAAVPGLEARVRELSGQKDVRAITLDLGGLRFIDSTGLAAIVLASRLCAKHGQGFELIPGPRPVQRMFERSGLLDELPFRSPEPA